jgi:hypothetical protein
MDVEFDQFVRDIGWAVGLDELRQLVGPLVDGPGRGEARLVGSPRLGGNVYRLAFDGGAGAPARSLVLKRLNPAWGHVNELLARRWLPAAGLGHIGPPLLGVAAERGGRWVWHAYEDLQADALSELNPNPEAVAAAVDAVVQVHARFAGHPLLAECRSHAGDRGGRFYSSQVRDAMRALEALGPEHFDLCAERAALRDRLLRRLERFLEQEPEQLRLLRECGGPETLLHGDLWPKNVLLERATGGGLRARLIDWDRAAVGPVSYDVSTFLSRFAPRDRRWILERYRAALARAGWDLPADRELGRLLDLAESSRLANCVIWPALDAWEDRGQWAWDELALVERWFAAARPILPDQSEGRL